MSDSPNAAAPAASPPSDEHDALPAGTRFGELEILRVVGVGGFGIVYLARDHSLDRDVALKEYMPGQLAARGPSAQVSVRSGSHMETFALGLRSFVNEARLLARFDHRSLVKVYRFWEANNTAYMVMPFLQGRTLRESRRAMSKAPDEAWMRQTLSPLLEALEILHRETVYHRDIAPDNILLPSDGSQPVLLDFGAARRAIGDRTQTFTAILKPSYAPIEQYAESVSLRQGPWTDLYAMGAVIHYLLKGVPPPPATARTFEDHSEVLAELNIPGVSRDFLAAVDWALAVRPQDRPQSVAEFRDALNGKLAAPVVARKPPPAPPSSDAFVRTAADPTRPMVREGASMPPTTGAEAATAISWPQDPQPADTRPAAAKTLGDPTAPFKAASSPQARAPQDASSRPRHPTAVAEQTTVPGASTAGAASAFSRFWPWMLPVLLLLMAIAAWWWNANRFRAPDADPSPVATGAVAASAVNLAVPASAAAPIPSVNTATVTPPPSLPAVVPATTPDPPASTAAAATAVQPTAPSPAPATTVPAPTPVQANAAAKAPPVPRANNNSNREDVPSAAGNAANTANANTNTAPPIVLERRPPRGQANEAARGNSGDGGANNQGQRNAGSPMWPPVPAAHEETKPKAAAARTSEAPPPDSPQQICAPRSFLIRLACMERECRSARFVSHPQCAEIRAREEMRQQGNTYGGNR